MYLSAGVTLLDNTFRNNYVFLYMVLFAFRGEERGGYQDHESSLANLKMKLHSATLSQVSVDWFFFLPGCMKRP